MSRQLPHYQILGTASTALLVSTSWLSSSAHAATAAADVRYERDNYALYRGRVEPSYLTNELGSFKLRLAAHATTAGGYRFQGIPGGFRSYGGADASVYLVVPSLELRGTGGVENFLRPESFLADARLKWAPEWLHGFSTKAATTSRWLDGWFSYGVRSTAFSGAIAYDTDQTWAEVGGIWDERSAGQQPAMPLRLVLQDNRIATLYAWWSHSLTDWLVGGLAGSWTDSEQDFHQPTEIVNGMFRYADYPYSTPHNETTWATLLQLHVSRFKLKATWPIASSGSYRIEDPYSMTPSYYDARDMAAAELRASVDSPITDTLSFVLEVFAMSRPYQEQAWFTNNAWNQFGANLVFQHRAEPKKP